MARPARGLFPRIIDPANVWQAWLAAREHKRRRPDVARFALDAEAEVRRLAALLAAEQWRPGGYRRLIIRRPKPRLIAAAPFRDRVIHHAIHRVIAPVLHRRFMPESFACLPGRGTHRAVLAFQQAMRRHRYLIRLDVRRYFLEIDHAVLLSIIDRAIDDALLRRLVVTVLDSGRNLYADARLLAALGLADTYQPRPDKGLPIGNLTSQLFANVYLDGADHHIKRVLKVPSYVRYMDDLTLFGDRRGLLQKQAEAITAWLGEHRRVELREKGDGPLSCRGTHTFLGYTVSRTERRVARRTVRRMRGRLKAAVRAGGAVTEADQRRIATELRAHLRGLVL